MSKQSTTQQSAGRTILALTVGGAPRPIAHSIAAIRPDHVIFFASEESARSITQEGAAPAKPGDRDMRGVLQILAGMKHPVAADQYEIVTVPEQDLHGCVVAMRESLLQACDGIADGDRLLLDFTGGTKLMSAALALAGERLPASYCYVAARQGSRSRDKDGLGITVDGEERLLKMQNPRDVSVFGVIEDALVLMRMGAFGPAARLLEAHRQRIQEPARKRDLQAWIHFAGAYDEWENFRHREASRCLDKMLPWVESLTSALPPSEATDLMEVIHENTDRLRVLGGQPDARALCLDLVANADRRAAENRFDDAILRLYRAAECHSEELLRNCGLDPSNIDCDAIPDDVIQAMELRRPRPGRRLLLGAQQKWELLRQLGEPDAERFLELKLFSEPDGRASTLALRNGSILVHGYHRATRKEWKRLRYGVTSLLRIDDGELVRFPLATTKGRNR